MAKEMLINVSEGEECRIALVENGRLEELYMERTSSTSHVGNIYKGFVTNVEPSIQAAFVDFGLGRNGFLHISDLMPSYFGRQGDDIKESVGRKMARRDRPPIQRCLRRGDQIIVQIIKEGIGTKGPTLTTYLSIPGRILVMMPGMSKLGVSRKIEDEVERRRLRQILDSLKPPRECGFIIRTAGVGKSKAEIQKDLTYLTRLWQNIDKQLKSGKRPMELYTEGDLVTRTVRDVMTPDIERILVDNKDVAKRIRDFIKIAMPRTKTKLELHEAPVPLFHKYGIEREIELMYSRHVPLPSGGSLVIDSTEAIVAIDVNSGKFRDHSDAETTAFKTDMEAADEIPRQLRLRDLGGVIICDFIDLRYERHRRELERTLHDNLKNDRAKTKMLRMSQFGIIEMTRQRMRPSLKRSIYFDCPYCKGAGLVKTPESMSLDVVRRLAIAASDDRVNRIELSVCPDVAFYLQNRKRAQLASLEAHFQKRILIRSDQTLGLDAMKLELFDARDGLVFVQELGMAPQPIAAPGGRPQPGPQRRDERRDRRPRGGRGEQGRRQEGRFEGGREDQRHREEDRRPEQRPVARQEEMEERDERFDIDRVEDEVEQREEQIMEESVGGPEAIAPSPGPVEVREAFEATAPAERGDMLAGSEDRGRPSIEEFAGAAETAEGGEGGGEDVMGPAATEITSGPPMVGRQEQRPVEMELGHGRGRSRGRGRGRGRGSEGMMPAPTTASARSEAREMAATEPPPVAAAIAAGVGSIVPEPGGHEGGKKKTRRGSRGGARRGRSKKAKTEAESVGAVAKAKPAVQSAPVAAPLVVRTGSTDRHLISDEPVLPQPVYRPRTYRDLDHIPDDLE